MITRALAALAAWAFIAPCLAQSGGYPASPSHGVVGRPDPSGAPRYGSEQTRGAGRNASDEGTAKKDGAKDANGKDEPTNNESGGANANRR